MAEKPGFEFEGCVEAVLVAHQIGSSASSPLPKIQAICGEGIKGDRHAGVRLADVRERALLEFGLPKGLQVANVRQFSAISLEELAVIQRELGLPASINYGSLGENLVVSGIPNFTQLPAGTLLFFEKADGTKRTAVLAVWGENMPCTAPGELIQAAFPDIPHLAKRFPGAAINRRGVVGFPYSSGYIHVGDRVFVRLPPPRP